MTTDDMQHQLIHLIDANTFVISDTHFAHEKIKVFEPCRVQRMKDKGYRDHDQMIIDSINQTVGHDGILLLVGDFAFKNIERYANALVAKHKILILGNHDRKGVNTYEPHGWHVVRGIHVGLHGIHHMPMVHQSDDKLLSGVVKEINGQRVLIAHYPVFDNDTRERSSKNASMIASRRTKLEDMYKTLVCHVNIHGHTHSRNSTFHKAINVSCEPMNFVPRKIGELISGA